MRLSFSTLGCPAWTVDQIVRAAVDYGYEGVEIRGIQEHVDLRESPCFAPSALPQMRRLFGDAGVEICCLGSSASFADPAKRQSSMKEARDYVELAANLGCPLVRVFGGTSPGGDADEDSAAAVAECLAALASFASDHRISLALETHDAFSTGARVARVLEKVGHRAVGALWDLHHPFREGEPPEETLRLIRPFLVHTHVKDSRDGRYCLLGEGEVPIQQMVRSLTPHTCPHGRPLWISLEWEKRWRPEIADPEVAFPQYAAKLREYLGVEQ